MAKGRKVETRGRPPRKDTKSNASKETVKTEEEMHADNSNDTDPVTAEEPLNSNGLLSKKPKPNTPTLSVRRSSRLSPNHDMVPTAKRANLDESEKEEGTLVEQVNALPITVERNGYKSKVTERPSEGPSDGMNYRSLYFESQKKIDFLLEQNLRLNKDLEFCRGKIDAYENMKAVMMAKPKEVILINNSGEVKEYMANLFPQTTLANCSSPTRVASPDAVDDTKKTSKRKYTRTSKS